MIRNAGGDQHRTYGDLAEFCRRNRHLKKGWVASQIPTSPDRFSKLKNKRKYHVEPTDAEVRGIARLLNQSESYVRDYYRPASAAHPDTVGRTAPAQ